MSELLNKLNHKQNTVMDLDTINLQLKGISYKLYTNTFIIISCG